MGFIYNFTYIACISIVVDWLQAHSALITSIATGILAGITWLYLRETKRIRLYSTRPYLDAIPFTENANFRFNSYLIITNEGKGSAFNVKGTIRYPLMKGDDSAPQEYKEEVLDVSYRPIPVGQGIKVPLEMWKGNNIPSATEADKPRFTITLNYEGSYEKNISIKKSFSIRDFNRKWDPREKSLLFHRYLID